MIKANSVEAMLRLYPETKDTPVISEFDVMLRIWPVEYTIRQGVVDACKPSVVKLAIQTAIELSKLRAAAPDGLLGDECNEVVIPLALEPNSSTEDAARYLAANFSGMVDNPVFEVSEPYSLTFDITGKGREIINKASKWFFMPKRFAALEMSGRLGNLLSLVYHLYSDAWESYATGVKPKRQFFPWSVQRVTSYTKLAMTDYNRSTKLPALLQMLIDKGYFTRQSKIDPSEFGRIKLEPVDFRKLTSMVSDHLNCTDTYTPSSEEAEVSEPSIQPGQPRTAQSSFSGFDFGALKEIRARMSLMIAGIDRLGDDDASIHGHALLKRLKELAND